MKSSIESEAPRITPGNVLSRQLATRQERTYDGEQIEIRDHQREAMAAINQFLNSDEKAGHVEMATATGKTYLISTVAQAAADLGMRTLILAPTLRIAQQLAGEDGEKGLGKFTDLQETGRVGQRYGGNLSTRNLEQPVVITTYQSLNNLYKAGLAPNVDLILADEAHHSLGDVTSKTMEDFSPQAIKMAFTATPAYSEEKSLDQLFPEKIFSLDIRDSVERGLTPPISSIVYETGDEIVTLDPTRTDFTERELARLITIKSRNEAIIKFSKNFVESGMQGAVACLPGGDLAHPRLVADELNKQVITDKNGESRAMRAVSVGAHRTPDDNQLIIDAYDRGKIDVLTFVYSLEQGWDSERPQFMINASPTTSSVRETQLLGRLLRGDDEVFFVDFLDVARKRQYTSLHVLGEEKIDTHRRIGGKTRSGYHRSHIDIGTILDADIYQAIQITDGKLLSQLYLGEVNPEQERLIQKWNRILEMEGLSEEPGSELKVSDLAMQSFRRARAALGEDASVEDLATYAVDHQSTSQELSRKAIHGHITAAHLKTVNNDMADIDDYEVFVDQDIAPEIVEQDALRKKIDAILSDVTEREEGVIRMRYGLDDSGEMKTLDQIGDALGFGRERIRQIEAKTMAKLRHPSRSNPLRDFLYEPHPRHLVSMRPEEPEEPAYTLPEGMNHFLRYSLAQFKEAYYEQALVDMANRKNPLPESVALPLIRQRHNMLSNSIADQSFPDPLVVDEIAQIEGYISGLQKFYTDPDRYRIEYKRDPEAQNEDEEE